MLLVLSEEQREHLSLLKQFKPEIAREICKTAFEFIKNGINVKKYQTAAQKLDTESKIIQKTVESLMCVVTECTKLSLSMEDFQISIDVLNFSNELVEDLSAMYGESWEQIRKIMKNMALVARHYRDLEWRFDVKVSSRMKKYQTTPEILLRFHFFHGETEISNAFQTDIVSLANLTKELEIALNDAKTSRSKKIDRVF